MQRIFEKGEGKIYVLSILLRPVVWTHAPFAHLSVLPSNKKPVTSWGRRDEAFVDIVLGIERVALNIWMHKALQTGDVGSILTGILGLITQWKKLSPEEYYKRSFVTYDKALLTDPYSGRVHHQRGKLLKLLGRSWQAKRFSVQAERLGYKG